MVGRPSGGFPRRWFRWGRAPHGALPSAGECLGGARRSFVACCSERSFRAGLASQAGAPPGGPRARRSSARRAAPGGSVGTAASAGGRGFGSASAAHRRGSSSGAWGRILASGVAQLARTAADVDGPSGPPGGRVDPASSAHGRVAGGGLSNGGPSSRGAGSHCAPFSERFDSARRCSRASADHQPDSTAPRCFTDAGGRAEQRVR